MRNEPRPYQKSAGLALWEWLKSKTGNPLIVVPVGAGKSLMIAEFIGEVQAMYPRTRIVVLAHVKELLQQNAAELNKQRPGLDYGFYCDGLGQKRLHNDITFASIQSVGNKIAAFNRVPEIIIIDECHLISHDDSTLYRKFLDAIKGSKPGAEIEVKGLNPNAKIIGFTGSPFRADTGRLDRGEGKIFDGIAYEIAIGWMIEQGYLVRPIMPMVKTRLDTEGVKVSKGDFIGRQLEAAIDVDEITKQCVSELVALSDGRKRWFGMTAGIKHCTHVRDEIRSYGIECEMITGDKKITPDKERQRIIEWFKEAPKPGEPARCLVNVGTMNVGFNAIHIDLLFPMRPTRSPVLYIQYTGRGLRPVYAPGFDLETQAGRLAAIAASAKPNVMFLDFGGIVATLGPIDAVTVEKENKKKEETGGPPPFKICPDCKATCATAQKFCYECSYHFAAHSVSNTTDKVSAILLADVPIEKYKVMYAEYRLHYKGGDESLVPSFRVIYTTTRGNVSDYFYFEPDAKMRWRAEAWFQHCMPNYNVPNNSKEAMQYAMFGQREVCFYPLPKTISVKKEGDWKRIHSYEFDLEPQPIQLPPPPEYVPEWSDEIPF